MKKDVRVEITFCEESIRDAFVSKFQEVEALQQFFDSFRDNWNKSMLKFEQEYSIGLEIKQLFNEIFETEEFERACEKAKSNYIGDKKITQIIDFTTSIDEETGRKGITYSMKPNFSNQNPNIVWNGKGKLEGQKIIFYRTILSNIIIIFEDYLSHVYEMVVMTDPKKYFENKTTQISNLFSSSMEQIIRSEVRLEVENNMYDSLKTLDKIRDRSRFNVDRFVKIKEDFEEIYYRRNLFVHADGIVNDIYISNVSKRFTKDLNVGDRLVCDDEYLKNAILILKKMICVLYYELLLVINASEDSYLVLSQNIAFEALSNGEYIFSEYVYNILRKTKSFDFSQHTIYQVNYMIALKQQGKSIQQELSGFDVSAMQEIFVIAKYCLEEKNKDVYDLLSQTYPKTYDAISIRDWPIFIDFRKSEYYEVFVSEHSNDFQKYFIETDDLDSEMDANAEQNDDLAVVCV